MRGNLRQSSLAEVLRHLFAERKSGVLRFAREGQERSVYLLKGVPIFAETAEAPTVGREQAESLLYSLFSWISGEFHFEEVEPKVDEESALTASAPVTILEGSRRIKDPKVLQHLLGGPGSLFACAQTSVLPLFTMKLSPSESAILKFARERERFTARELPFPARTLEVVRALNALVSVGLVEVVQKAAVPASRPPMPPSKAPVPQNPAGHSPRVAAPTTSSIPQVPARRQTPYVPPPAAPVPELPRNVFPAREPAAPSPSMASSLEPPGETGPPVSSAATNAAPAPIPASKPAPTGLQEPSAAAPAETAPPYAEGEVRLASTPPQAQRRSPLRGIALAGASLAALAVAVVVVLSLRSRQDEAAPSDAVIAADSAPEPAPEPAAPRAENAVSSERITAEPTEAELFYSANLAFGNGEYERSKADLTTLLERQPDFAAARDLLARVERELTPKPRAPEPPRVPARPVEKPSEPAPVRTPAPASAPDPAELFDAARSALARSDLETARARLDALRALDASYPGAAALQEELAMRFWARTLPLAFDVRHDHALGSCNGVLQLTESGFSYRSQEHEWMWSFAEVAETERRDASRLRIETTKRTSYNFQLKKGPSEEDWARHQALRRR